MKNVYLPNIDYPCIIVYDNDTIRAYHSRPSIESTVTYTDYYVNSHYLQKEGTQSFGRYNTNLPNCLDSNIFTNNVYYRNDITSILVGFLIISLIVFGIPLKIITRLFKRFR